jgi:hypothetical protein
MASPHTIERQRGAKEASQQLGVLRERWPLAFPAKPHDVRPLALGTVGQIAEAMGWSVPYTIGVLTYWKMAPVYCQAVLLHDHASPLTARRRKRSMPRRRNWRRGNWRGSKRAGLRRKQQSRSGRPLPRRPSHQCHCARGCGPRSCGGAHKSRLFVTVILNRRVCSKR